MAAKPIEKKHIKLKNFITVQMKYTFFSAVILGILAHGFAMFNKYNAHDDVTELFDIGSSFGSGRWMLGLLKKFFNVVTGHSTFSLPLVNGIVSILFIALSACVIIRLMQVKRRSSCVLIAALFVVSPVICGLFSFMFTAPYYMFGLLMAVCGTYLICRMKKWYWFVSGMVLIICSIGVYQAYIPFVLCVFILYLMRAAVYEEDFGFAYFFKRAGLYVGAVVGSLVIYLLINRGFLWLFHISMAEYKGLSTMGQEGVLTYISRIRDAYINFFYVSNYDTINGLYSPHRGAFYYLILFASLVLSVIVIAGLFKKSKCRAVCFIILLALFPLAVNFVYVMCASKEIHTLMLYSNVMVYFWFFWLLEQIEFTREKLKKFVCVAASCVIALLSVLYVIYDNVCYLEDEIMKQNSISYLTTLTTQIKSVPGYKAEYPVAFINAKKNSDPTFSDESISDNFAFIKINYYPNVSQRPTYDNVWPRYMNLWTGFCPELADPKAFEDLDEVKAMPCYPDDGSIKIINDTVVVKFN